MKIIRLLFIVLLFFTNNKVFADNQLFSDTVKINNFPSGKTQGIDNIIRERLVQVNFSLLIKTSSFSKPLAPDERGTILFNLFHSIKYHVYRVKTETLNSGKTTIWHGKIQGMEKSSVTIAITDNIAMGSIRTDKGELYKIKFVTDDVHAIQLIDQSLFPPD